MWATIGYSLAESILATTNALPSFCIITEPCELPPVKKSNVFKDKSVLYADIYLSDDGLAKCRSAECPVDWSSSTESFFSFIKIEKRQLWVQPIEWLKLNFASCVVHLLVCLSIIYNIVAQNLRKVVRACYMFDPRERYRSMTPLHVVRVNRTIFQNNNNSVHETIKPEVLQKIEKRLLRRGLLLL